MDFKRYLLLLLHHFAIDRANNSRSFLISSQLNRSEVPTFIPRVGRSKLKVLTFPHHKGRNLLQSPHKVSLFPHISPGSPPPLRGKPMTSALTLERRSRINRPFAAKPSRDPLFRKLWAITLKMPEMEKACRENHNGQV